MSGQDRPSGNHRVVRLSNDRDAFRERYSELMELLPRKLQVTLDIDELLQIFCEQINRLVGVQKFEYRHEGLVLTPLHETPSGRHHADYNLTLEGISLGNILLYRRLRFDEIELEAIEQLFSTLVYPLRNCLMYREAQRVALTDGLTGVPNKRAFDYQMPRDLRLATRYSQPLALLMLGFYVVFAFNHVLDSYFYGVGRTDLMLYQSLFVSVVWYGSAFVAYRAGLFVPDLERIALLFGGGIVLDSLVTAWQFKRAGYVRTGAQGATATGR